MPHNYLCVIIQGLSLDANNYKQRPHYLPHHNNSKCTWNATINKSHRIQRHSVRIQFAFSWCNCKIIHCKVSKKCNWNANQCKSILESSSAAAASSEWMIHSSHASNIQMQIHKSQMPNAKCKLQWKFCRPRRRAHSLAQSDRAGNPLICEQSNQNKIKHTERKERERQ